MSQEVVLVAGDASIGMWLSSDNVPRLPGFVSGRSRRYAEWKTLAFEATSDPIFASRKARAEAKYIVSLPPAVERRSYPKPTAIFK